MMSTPYWSSPMAKLMNSTRPAALATLSPAPAAIDPSLTLPAGALAISVAIAHHLIVDRAGGAVTDRESRIPGQLRLACRHRALTRGLRHEQEAANRPIQCHGRLLG